MTIERTVYLETMRKKKAKYFYLESLLVKTSEEKVIDFLTQEMLILSKDILEIEEYLY